MMLVWTVDWTIFAANPLATYSAERTVVRTLEQQADVTARISASKAASAALASTRQL